MMSMQNSNKPISVAVIGGGAAGLLCAAVAGEAGAEVTLFEKNEKVGRKLAITGKGRCNLTNNCDPQEFIKSVVSNPRFLMSSIYSFTPSDTISLFEERLGVKLKTERGRRVFPESDKAYDIVDALFCYARSNAKIINEKVCSVKKENGNFTISTDKRNYSFDLAVIATGGRSYPLTGSTGDGYVFSKALGHTVTPLSPSLVPITSRDASCPSLMGLSLKNTALKIVNDKNRKVIYEDFGEMMFTHFGLTGPMILSASSHLHGVNVSDCTAYIDIKPALDEKTLDAKILSVFESAKNKSFENAILPMIPSKFASYIPKYTEIDGKKKVCEITKEERKRFLYALKSFKVKLSGFRPIEEAIITRGGINVKEIDPKTMHSKLCQGLYIIGEVLDLDAYTGGYNLQIAFSTAYAAASDIATMIHSKEI